MKLILFDFDGVLVNTIEFSYKIHKENNKNFTFEQFQNFSNGNYYKGIGAAVTSGHILQTIAEFKNNYDAYVATMSVHDILYNTVIKLSKIYTLSIVSSMFDESIIKFLEKENLKKCFSDILGANVHINKAIKINMLLEKYKISPDDTVFITDSLGDVLEAHECGVKSIGVLWGIHPHETLKSGNPEKIIDNPMDLYDTVKEILG